LNRTPADEKAELRRALSAQRDALSPADVKKRSADVCRNLLQLPELATAKNVGVYLPIGNEVDTFPLVHRWLIQGIGVYLPVRVHEGPWHFVRFTEQTAFVMNRHGIWTPTDYEPEPTPTLDVILVPGLGFTPTGVRLGRGGGHYDRLLARAHGVFVGLAYNFQILEVLPCETHDIRLHYIVTETKIFRTATS